MPPTLNEQTSIYLQIAKMLEDGILRGIYENVKAADNPAKMLALLDTLA